MLHKVILSLGLLAHTCSGALFEDTTDENDVGFQFISKFCFDVARPKDDPEARAGEITVEISMANGEDIPSGMEILLYDDEHDPANGIYGWQDVYPAVEDGDITCEKAYNWAKNVQDGKKMIVTPGVKTFVAGEDQFQLTQKLRPRFWYIVVSSCGNKKVPELSYKVTMTQIPSDKTKDEDYGYSSWSVEFSFNEVGLNTLYVVFLIPCGIGLVLEIASVIGLRKKMKFVHPLVRLFLTAVFLQFLIVLFKVFHYVTFTSNGVGVSSLSTLGDLLDIIKQGIFLLTIMLLAQGWTISTEEIGSKKLVVIVVVAFLIVDFLIYLWESVARNPAQTSLSASSFLLYTASAAWFVFSAWFALLVWRSYKAEDNPVKKSLFFKLGLFYFPWVFGNPFVFFLTLILDPWVRDITIASVELILTLAGYSYLGFLLWPSRAGEYFEISTPNVQTSGMDHYDQL